MALSYVKLVGDGSTKQLSFPPLYLDRSHVFATVDGVPKPFEWLNDSLVELAAPPVVGAIVVLRRITPRERLEVVYKGGSVLKESSLNTQALQSLFIAQEALDASDDAVLFANTALSVSKAADEKSDLALGTAEQAVATAREAKDKSEEAVEKATEALQTSEAAFETASASDVKADKALGTANGIDAKAQQALDQSTEALGLTAGFDAKAQEALDTANDAKTTADAIDGKAQTALDQSTKAVAVATEAASNSAEALEIAQEAAITANGVDGKAQMALEQSTAALEGTEAAITEFREDLEQLEETKQTKRDPVTIKDWKLFEDGTHLAVNYNDESIVTFLTNGNLQTKFFGDLNLYIENKKNEAYNAATGWAYYNLVQDVRVAGGGVTNYRSGWVTNGNGEIVTGIAWSGATYRGVDAVYSRWLQVRKGGNWYTVSVA